MDIKDVVLEEEKQEIRRFLKRFHLTYEDDIDITLALYEDDALIATASSAANIIKSVAVHPAYQGRGYLNPLMSALIKRLHEKGVRHLFVYTLPEHVDLFKHLGFTSIVESMNMSFLERGGDIRATLVSMRDEYGVSRRAKGSVVINANPLTKGHLHLIDTALEDCGELLVFVVSEDRSFFPFEERFAIIEKALADREGVTVLPSGDYLISFATFPKYFSKQEKNIQKDHAVIDVLTFKQHYMDIFNINVRYVGEEPYSPMTKTYNATMKHYLGSKLRIIERKTLEATPISASTVRKLLKKNGVEAVRKYVPEATYRYLKSESGRRAVEALKSHDARH